MPLAVPFYERELCTLTKKQESKIQTSEMAFLREPYKVLLLYEPYLRREKMI